MITYKDCIININNTGVDGVQDNSLFFIDIYTHDGKCIYGCDPDARIGGKTYGGALAVAKQYVDFRAIEKIRKGQLKAYGIDDEDLTLKRRVP